MTKEKKRKIVFWCIAFLILLIVVLVLVECFKRNNIENRIDVELSPIVKHQSLCEQRVVDEFQIIEPEFQWKESDGNSNSYYWKVTYLELENQVNITEFECKISNNWNEVRINRDIGNNPDVEDIIYDDWQ